MKKYMKKFLYLLRYFPIALGDTRSNRALEQDICRWAEILSLNGGRREIVAQLLFRYPEFRSLFIYRNQSRFLYCIWVKLFYKPMDTLYIEAFEIGGGLFIQHGFSTMIAAKSIGENCWINQQVTIGYNGHGDAPVIGSNVMITCGAKVLGNITVGNHAVIGANAVVVKDVEENATMVGIPARRIK